MNSTLLFAKDIISIYFSHSIKYNLSVEYNIMAAFASMFRSKINPTKMGNVASTVSNFTSGTGNAVTPNIGNNLSSQMITSESNSGFQNWIGTILGKNGFDILRGIGVILLIIAIVIVLVIYFTGGFDSSKKKKKSRRSAAYKKKSKKKKTKKSLYNRIKSKIFGIRNPLGKKAYGGLPRSIEKNGRCDNINWLSINNGKSALCVNASFKQPDPVRFIIDPTNLYEYEMLPNKIKSNIRKDTGKLSITIPYKYNEKPSAYVLDFSNAVYEDKTSAKGLFNERFDFDYWNFKTKNLNISPSGNVYRYESKFRPVKTAGNYRGIDSYL